MVDWPPKLIERLNAPTGEEEFNTLLPIGSARNASQQQQQLENLHGRTLNLPNYYVTHSKVYFEVFSACIIAFLLNLLDVITYGRIVFPSLPSTIGSMSVTAPNTMVMTILTSVIAQLCFTAFSSMDYGVLAGMMVEVIPFYHAYFWTIYHTLALDEPILTDFSSLYPTLFFMVFISSASIALLFYILGTSFLSKLLQFFPRQVIYGCMGAIGYFLFTTGIDLIVSGFESANLAASSHRVTIIDKIWIIFSSSVLLIILGVSLLASLTAALLQRHKLSAGNPFTIPTLCFFLTFAFYISLLISGHSLDEARKLGWILISPNEESKTSDGFWNMFDFYKYYFEPSKIDWSLIPHLFSTYLGMITFALINVPINVPAFSAATNQHPSLKRELSLHGFSNLFGLLGGGLANYFIFSNSLLFFQSGGSRTRQAGYIVAVLTLFGLLFIYYDIFDFLPKFVPVFLVFYLTIELFWEAFIKSYAYIYDKRELLIIVSIVLIASMVGFSEGLFIGLGLSLLDTVLKMSLVPISDISYPPMHFPSDVHIVSLSGYLFFGNVDQMVDVFQQLMPLLASNENATIILDFRGLVGWDLTFQLEFKGLTDLYRTLLSHPSITWLMIGSRQYVDLLLRAGWLETSIEDFVRLRAASPESDEIYFKHISALVDLDQALSQQRDLVKSDNN